MRLIDADALYERLEELEELARDRVIDTPNSFPNGALNPAAVRYSAQLSERTMLKQMIFDAPTIEPMRKKGKWKRRLVDSGFNADWHCSECGWKTALEEHGYNYCPNCGSYNGGDNNG